MQIIVNYLKFGFMNDFMTVREKSAGAIIYRVEGGRILYLLLKYREGHWDFPKGHMEQGETEAETMRREVREETGIEDLSVISGFKRVINYFYTSGDESYFKEVVFFLAKTDLIDIHLSDEHQDCSWLEFAPAVAKITFKNAKAILESANEFLTSYLKG
jgi:bis(5'-nucleosidyl)-tetraphosphatase